MSLIITFLIVLTIAALVWYVISILPLPPIARTIALVVFCLILILLLLQFLPGYHGFYLH